MAEDGPFGAGFLDPQNPPEKVYVVPFLRSFPGNEAHQLFSGGLKSGVLGGSQKIYVEKFMCFFPPLIKIARFDLSGKFNLPTGTGWRAMV